jgi:hypothetical protein
MKQSDIDQATREAICAVLVFAGKGFLLGLLLCSPLLLGNWKGFLSLALIFASCGAYYGAIVGLDISSDMTTIDRPMLRTTLCGTLACFIVFIFQSSILQNHNVAWIMAVTTVGAFLGWLGWSWARYIDSFIDFIIRLISH